MTPEFISTVSMAVILFTFILGIVCAFYFTLKAINSKFYVPKSPKVVMPTLREVINEEKHGGAHKPDATAAAVAQ